MLSFGWWGMKLKPLGNILNALEGLGFHSISLPTASRELGPAAPRLDLCGLKARRYSRDLIAIRYRFIELIQPKCSDVLFKTGGDLADRLRLGS